MPDRSAFGLQNRLHRRLLLSGAAHGIGAAAAGALLAGGQQAHGAVGMAGLPHVEPKARRVISLYMSGGPSQLDLFDAKPDLEKRRGEALPESIRNGQRLTGMTADQALQIMPSDFRFARHGESGAWFSDLLPHMATTADRWCIVQSVHTEAINHDPAITFTQTGSQLAGRPSIGSWVSYGLGSENRELPAYIVLTSYGTGRKEDQPLFDRLWGSGFLPSQHQGVRFRNRGDAVLYVSNPPGIDRALRKETLDRLGALNRQHQEQVGDPEIAARISQYEMAFRMQASVPELLDTSGELKRDLEAYGPDVTRPGTYAANCLLARRLAERDVRFIQLFHMGWDHHSGLPVRMRGQCSDIDRPTAALIEDLARLGLLDDTLVVLGGEFGRTVFAQRKITGGIYGRDHHPRCFTALLAGGGVRPGLTHGETDEFGYNVVRDPVHVHDLNATILHLLGIDHTRLTHRFQGRDFRLTDVHGTVVRPILTAG
jgi:hypothetical protein